MSNSTIQTQLLIKLFKENSNPDNAAHMARYMKNQFSFFGIKSPERRTLTQEWLKIITVKSLSDIRNIMNALWKLNKREFQYVACDLGKQYKKYWTPNSLEFIKGLICTKSWWDTVDVIASHMAGTVVYNHTATANIMDDWIDHPNMWIRRTAILHQLNFKEKTDARRLFSYCKKRMQENEFFIRKAIGWALMQYSYLDPKGVIQFVNEYDDNLSPLSKMEALKAMKREGKI
jgi:3-methyladenine DNA glycosylase AlkD